MEADLGGLAVPTSLRRIDTTALLHFLRFGLAEGATRIHFRVGRPPDFAVGGEQRTLRYRQLAREDTEAILRLLFEQTRVPERLSSEPVPGGQEIYFFVELPGEALFEIDASREEAGIALSLEIIRPLTNPAEIALLES
jgi:Tfp pilus assembly pilus retraction ATPase PilT